jgi:hypothetical protein
MHRPPLPSEYITGTHFSYRLSRAQCHIVAGKDRVNEISNDTIGIRTRDLPASGAVPQPTASPRASDLPG